MRLQTLQQGRYKIISILGQGGYGITYLAEQTTLGRQVAIKEFFMKDYCGRAAGSPEVTLGTDGSREMLLRYREKFKKEAATRVCCTTFLKEEYFLEQLALNY